jgi:hypothetical protein
MHPDITVNEIARSASGPAMLAKGHFQVEMEGHYFQVQTTRVGTPLGKFLWLLLCPACHRRCRHLHITEKLQLLCAKCAHVRHPDQQTSGSKRGLIVRRAQQIQRLSARLARSGLDRVTRRRLRRRRERLLKQLAAALHTRQTRMAAQAQALLASLVADLPEPPDTGLRAAQ